MGRPRKIRPEEAAEPGTSLVLVAPPKAKKKHTTEEHFPTQESRAIVMAGVMCNHNREFIAKALRISENTMRKHYKAELAEGDKIQEARLAGTLLAHAARGDKVSCIFLLKTKFKWREIHSVEHSGSIKSNVRFEADFAPAPDVAATVTPAVQRTH
jgi:hypothetical protein